MMIDVITVSIVLALTTIFVTKLPYYSYLETKVGKPFSCVYCLSFWLTLLICGLNLIALPPFQLLLITAVTPVLATAFERLIDLLPIRLK
ncbi:hypothetical protein [Sphingobacterium sp. IITKGP-BTPF85]|uniref:hypothetical protein n=1 Tax=Sphingobacterium sp. IITKGP-BTPF85 TaxID=1338009 RepID=UPI000405C13B|nr:hypothetical protein [Sphingobacterium sp. IITKGP-BTPF85]